MGVSNSWTFWELFEMLSFLSHGQFCTLTDYIWGPAGLQNQTQSTALHKSLLEKQPLLNERCFLHKSPLRKQKTTFWRISTLHLQKIKGLDLNSFSNVLVLDFGASAVVNTSIFRRHHQQRKFHYERCLCWGKKAKPQGKTGLSIFFWPATAGDQSSVITTTDRGKGGALPRQQRPGVKHARHG